LGGDGSNDWPKKSVKHQKVKQSDLKGQRGGPQQRRYWGTGQGPKQKLPTGEGGQEKFVSHGMMRKGEAQGAGGRRMKEHGPRNFQEQKKIRKREEGSASEAPGRGDPGETCSKREDIQTRSFSGEGGVLGKSRGLQMPKKNEEGGPGRYGENNPDG